MPTRLLPTAAPLVLLALASSSGCGASILPAEATAWQATGETEGCRVVSSFGEPLIVDWAAHQRGDLEESMHDGVSVVAYDCRTLRLLKDCRIDGRYGFMPLSKKEQTIRFESADEVAANLPAFGGPLLRDLRGELKQESTLDLEMILIGKKRTTVREASRDRLLGGPGCAGATHFVRGVFVGAFALGVGSKRGVSLGVNIFSAGTSGAKTSKYRDGEPETCKQVSAESTSPPDTCNALLRLELVELGAQTGKEDTQVAEQVCPAGLTLTEGKCARPASSAPHLCKKGDLADCTSECGKNDPGSCNSLGLMYQHGKLVEKDLTRALTLYDKACAGGNIYGCGNLGVAYEHGNGVQVDKPRAAALFRRACEGGSTDGCTKLGIVYELGLGLPKDQLKATALYARACDGGDAGSCSLLGLKYEQGTGIPQDYGRAAALHKQGCDGNVPLACGELGTLYHRGRGVPKDVPRAIALYKQACDGGSLLICGTLGELYEKGLDLPADHALALQYDRKACDGGKPGGQPEACDRLKALGEHP